MGVALIMTALGVTAPAGLAAGASVHARSAGACANQRVVLGSGAEVFDAFTLKGGISCGSAHALIKSYLHRATTGRGCSGRGTMCGYEMAGGWWCSVPGYAGAPVDAGCCHSGPGRLASCRPGSAGFTVRATSPPPGWHALLHLTAFELPDRSISCASSAFGRGYTSCSVSTSNQFGVPAAWMEAPRVRVCTQREELVQPEGEGSACPAFALRRRVILAYGQENELGGIRCTSAVQGMTCTFISGEAAGKGFRINSAEVVQVG